MTEEERDEKLAAAYVGDYLMPLYKLGVDPDDHFTIGGDYIAARDLKPEHMPEALRIARMNWSMLHANLEAMAKAKNSRSREFIRMADKPLEPKIVFADNGVEVGIKLDADKARWDLLPLDVLARVADVLTMGAVKYGDRNWEKGINASRLWAAAQRHLFAHASGEHLDQETGLPHMAHFACCALMLTATCSRQELEFFDDLKKLIG